MEVAKETNGTYVEDTKDTDIQKDQVSLMKIEEDLGMMDAEFRQHVRDSCIRKFSPLYFTGR